MEWGYRHRGDAYRTSEMAGDVVPLRTSGPAILPLAGETKIVGALPTYVVIAKMVVE